MGVSAVILTRNEAKNIERCLRSLQWADEIVVMDAESTDGTPEIAQKFGARVIVHPWEGGGKQADFAIPQTSGNWILMVDADEVISPELAKSVRRVVSLESPLWHTRSCELTMCLGDGSSMVGFIPAMNLGCSNEVMSVTTLVQFTIKQLWIDPLAY